MNRREDAAETEQRGPAPSVSTALLFLVMISVVAIFAGLSASADPTEHPLKPLLIVLIFVPVLVAWWFWARQRRHPQLGLFLGVAFFAVQFFFGVAQLALFDNDSRSTPIFAQLATLTAGMGFMGGLLYLWVQARKGKRN